MTSACISFVVALPHGNMNESYNTQISHATRTHCKALQHTATATTHCSVLQVCCSVLQMCCSVLQMCCSALQVIPRIHIGIYPSHLCPPAWLLCVRVSTRNESRRTLEWVTPHAHKCAHTRRRYPPAWQYLCVLHELRVCGSTHSHVRRAT